MEMQKVPEWARVSKDEYRTARKELEATCDAASFEFIGVWNLMIDWLVSKKREHDNGRRKSVPTLAEAVAKLQKMTIDERAKMMAEEKAAREPFITDHDLAVADAE